MNKNITVVNEVGMNIDSCHICNKQYEKLVKIRGIIPNVVNFDLTIKYELTLFMCKDCLDMACKKIRDK